MLLSERYFVNLMNYWRQDVFCRKYLPWTNPHWRVIILNPFRFTMSFFQIENKHKHSLKRKFVLELENIQNSIFHLFQKKKKGNHRMKLKRATFFSFLFHKFNGIIHRWFESFCDNFLLLFGILVSLTKRTVNSVEVVHFRRWINQMNVGDLTSFSIWFPSRFIHITYSLFSLFM